MSIHIEFWKVAEEEWVGPRPVFIIEEKKFESTTEATLWVQSLQKAFGFNRADTREVNNTIVVAASQYVGTEHELRDESGKYTQFGLSVEGKLGETTFDKHLPDVVAEKIIIEGGKIQLEGRTLEGRKVWQLISLNPLG